QGRPSHNEVGKDGSGEHEDFAHQAVGEMAQIMSPNPLEMRSLDQLTKEGIDAVPPARELPTPVWPGIMETATEGSEEGESLTRQVLAQARRPEVAVANDETVGRFGQVESGC